MASFRVMMVHLVSLVILENLADLVPKVSVNILQQICSSIKSTHPTSHVFLNNLILCVHPSIDSDFVPQVCLEKPMVILELQELKASKETQATQVRLTMLGYGNTNHPVLRFNWFSLWNDQEQACLNCS